MDSSIWNIFHDGTIDKITGSFPNITVIIEIQYLREMFSGNGNSFIVHLNDCDLFEYEPYEGPEKITGFADIASLEPEILSAKNEDDFVLVGCTTGCLRTRYKSFTLFSDNGMLITLEQLDEQCKAYWDNL